MCFTKSLKNQNKNFVTKINHEYFGGFNAMNVCIFHSDAGIGGAVEKLFLSWVWINVQKDWKAKLESAYSFM